MADDQDYTIGFQKPPKHTRFVKGKSGNPMGRPKGSYNAATVFDKACRERIRVTINGKTSYLTKHEAAQTQLMNKAAAGDLKAMQLLLNWFTWRLHSAEQSVPTIPLHERDKFVLANMLDRIRKSEPAPLATEPDLPLPEGDPEEQK
jgi:hypothetical protein